MAQVAASSPSAFSVFRNRNFTMLWFAQLVSAIGTSLSTLVAAIYVYQVTESALSVGLMLIVTAAPSLLFGLVAGVLVDRLDRRAVMIASDLIRAVLVLAIPFMLTYNIAWLYALVFLNTVVSQFFEPANASLIPDLATDEELAAANSLLSISSHGAWFVGYALAGLIAGSFSIAWAFYINALTYIISGLFVYFVSAPKTVVEGKTTVAAVWKNLGNGIDTVRSTAILRSLFLVYIPAFFAISFSNTLRLPFSIQALNATEFDYGLIEAGTFVGIVIGSLLFARFADRLHEGQWLSTSFIAMGITGAIFAYLVSVPVAIALIIVEGFLNTPSAVGRMIIIQRNTPRNVRGRVFSAFFVMRDTVFLLGMAAAGLADLFDVRLLYLTSSMILLASGLWALALPGLQQPAQVWQTAIRRLLTAPSGVRITTSRPALIADFNLLSGLQPAFAALDPQLRKKLVAQMNVLSAPEGSAILRKGDKSDCAYFILNGQAVAGIESDGRTRVLEVMNPGDIFGEISALSGIPRTADVVAASNTELLEVPAKTLRQVIADPQINRLVMSKMTARMMRTNLIDSPRVGAVDQNILLDLRTESAISPTQA